MLVSGEAVRSRFWAPVPWFWALALEWDLWSLDRRCPRGDPLSSKREMSRRLRPWNTSVWFSLRVDISVISIESQSLCDFHRESKSVWFSSRVDICVIFIESRYLCDFHRESISVWFSSRVGISVIFIESRHLCDFHRALASIVCWRLSCVDVCRVLI